MTRRRSAWEKIKEKGSKHYKATSIEPLDLIKAGGMLRAFAISNIIKYAYRNSDPNVPINPSDMEKIKHYVEMLIFLSEETEEAPHVCLRGLMGEVDH